MGGKWELKFSGNSWFIVKFPGELVWRVVKKADPTKPFNQKNMVCDSVDEDHEKASRRADELNAKEGEKNE